MIDWNRVSELREEIGAADFEEVAVMFLEEVDRVISRLKSQPDPARLEEDLHFLKGSALNIGFQRVGELCRETEPLAARGALHPTALAPIFQAYTLSKSEFAAR